VQFLLARHQGLIRLFRYFNNALQNTHLLNLRSRDIFDYKVDLLVFFYFGFQSIWGILGYDFSLFEDADFCADLRCLFNIMRSVKYGFARFPNCALNKIAYGP